MPEAPGDDIAMVRSWIDETDRIVVLTGAGISTDSGIPDFRGPERRCGRRTRRPRRPRRCSTTSTTPRPDVPHGDHASRTSATSSSPTPATARSSTSSDGQALALITQNVDGLHHQAGTDPARLIEVHGHTREVVCLSCGERAPMERALARVRAGEDDPPCRTCGGILKAATISFGQSLIEDDLVRADVGGAHLRPDARRRHHARASTRWPTSSRSRSGTGLAS